MIRGESCAFAEFGFTICGLSLWKSIIKNQVSEPYREPETNGPASKAETHSPGLYQRLLGKSKEGRLRNRDGYTGNSIGRQGVRCKGRPGIGGDTRGRLQT